MDVSPQVAHGEYVATLNSEAISMPAVQQPLLDSEAQVTRMQQMRFALELRGFAGVLSVSLGFSRFVADWWDFSSSEVYLSSPFSRREHWEILMPAVFLLGLIYDATSRETTWALFDVVAVGLSAIATKFLPRSSLLLDAQLAATLSMQWIARIALASPPWRIGMQSMLLLQAFACFALGIRLVALGLAFAMVIVADVLVDLTPSSVGFISAVVVVPLALMLEKRLAEASLGQAAMAQLLLQGRIVCASVSVTSGEILEATPSLKELFPEVRPGGTRLFELIREEDRGYLDTLLAKWTTGSQASFNCSIRTEVRSFDCRIFPLYATSRKVQLCFEQLREIRDSAEPRDAATFNLLLASGDGAESSSEQASDSHRKMRRRFESQQPRPPLSRKPRAPKRGGRSAPSTEHSSGVSKQHAKPANGASLAPASRADSDAVGSADEGITPANVVLHDL